MPSSIRKMNKIVNVQKTLVTQKYSILVRAHGFISHSQPKNSLQFVYSTTLKQFYEPVLNS